MSSSKAEVDLGKFAFGRKKEKHNDDHKKASEKEDSVDLGQFDPAHWGSPTSSKKSLGKSNKPPQRRGSHDKVDLGKFTPDPFGGGRRNSDPNLR